MSTERCFQSYRQYYSESKPEYVPKPKPPPLMELLDSLVDNGDGGMTYLGDGYHGVYGLNSLGFAVAYIVLPANHRDNFGDFDDLNRELCRFAQSNTYTVHGGFTWGDANIYGWDYAHADDKPGLNIYMKEIERDLKYAKDFFKRRE
jgi:hypothetical protein